MKAQMSLLSLAIASGLALAAIPAEAAGNLKSAAISRANVLLGANGASAIRAANGDVFAAREAIVDADGTEHVRFQRSYRGLRLRRARAPARAATARRSRSTRPAIAGRAASSR